MITTSLFRVPGWPCRLVAFLLMISCWTSNVSVAQAQEQARVRVALRSAVATNQATVLLGEIADLSGGDHRLRDEIAQVDLSVGDSFSISSDETVARLLLAGFRREQFLVDFGRMTQFNPGQAAISHQPVADLPLRIETSIQKRISHAFNVAQKDVLVTVDLQSIPDALKSYVFRPGSRVEPIQSAKDLIGRRQVEMGVFDADRLVQRAKISVTTHLYLEVMMTSQPIERGEALSSENTYLDRQIFETAHDSSQYLQKSALGKFAGHPLRAQQRLTNRDVSGHQLSTPKSEIAVKSRELVTVRLQVEDMIVTLSGAIAQKAGKIGDVIPVRNPKTKKTFSGRIAERGVVEIIQ